MVIVYMLEESWCKQDGVSPLNWAPSVAQNLIWLGEWVWITDMLNVMWGIVEMGEEVKS